MNETVNKRFLGSSVTRECSPWKWDAKKLHDFYSSDTVNQALFRLNGEFHENRRIPLTRYSQNLPQFHVVQNQLCAHYNAYRVPSYDAAGHINGWNSPPIIIRVENHPSLRMAWVKGALHVLGRRVLTAEEFTARRKAFRDQLIVKLEGNLVKARKYNPHTVSTLESELVYVKQTDVMVLTSAANMKRFRFSPYDFVRLDERNWNETRTQSDADILAGVDAEIKYTIPYQIPLDKHMEFNFWHRVHYHFSGVPLLENLPSTFTWPKEQLDEWYHDKDTNWTHGHEANAVKLFLESQMNLHEEIWAVRLNLNVDLYMFVDPQTSKMSTGNEDALMGYAQKVIAITALDIPDAETMTGKTDDYFNSLTWLYWKSCHYYWSLYR